MTSLVSDLKKLTQAFSTRHLQNAFGFLSEVKRMDHDHGTEVRIIGDRKDVLIKRNKKGKVEVIGDSKIGKGFAADICHALDE